MTIDDPNNNGCTVTSNIADRVAQMAKNFPEKVAIACPTGRKPDGSTQYAELTFSKLAGEIDRYAWGLTEAGITRGMRTILMVRPGTEFFALTFALFKIGAVVVLIDPGMGRRQLINCLAEVEAEAFIGVPLAHIARVIYRKAFAKVSVTVTVGCRLFWGGYKLADVRSTKKEPFQSCSTASNELAAILFTSGSTGPAKGVCYEHGMFAAQVECLSSHYGYNPEEIDLPTFPLFALFDAALGMTAIIPDMDFTKPAEVDPLNIIKPIAARNITHMFGSPALLNKVARYAVANGTTMPSLKRIMTAGAPVSSDILQHMSRVVSANADIFTPYGATEALPVASIESREIVEDTCRQTAVGKGICVGRPIGQVQVRVIGISDEAIPDWSDSLCVPVGEIGEICVKGPVVTKEYFRKPHATQSAKIADKTALWHRMGDVGYLDDSGRLWFCGRKSHRVVTPRQTMFTICCEAIFNQHPDVYRSALVGIGPIGEQMPVICVELEKGVQTRPAETLMKMAKSNPLTEEIEIILFHPSFPVDVRHNAKIFREKLATWAAEQLKWKS